MKLRRTATAFAASVLASMAMLVQASAPMQDQELQDREMELAAQLRCVVC